MTLSLPGTLDETTDKLLLEWSQVDQLSGAIRVVRKLRTELAVATAVVEKATAARDDILSRLDVADKGVVEAVAVVKTLFAGIVLKGAVVVETPAEVVIP